MRKFVLTILPLISLGLMLSACAERKQALETWVHADTGSYGAALSPDGRLLLTGDIERKGERALIEGGLRPATIVSVPHHGSRTSSTQAFVQAVDARYAVVSAARVNRWGLPLPDIVARWESAGSTVLNTGASGYLRLRLCESSGAGPVYHHRERRRFWWQR